MRYLKLLIILGWMGWFSLTEGLADVSRFKISETLSVPIKSFDAPVEELPFFGFKERTGAEKAQDDAFLETVDAQFPNRDVAFSDAIMAAWVALTQGDLARSGKHFNQAWLLDRTNSAVFHGYAIIVIERFEDRAYGLEMFRLAALAPNRRPGVLADFGRFLLKLGRNVEAIPILIEAINERPTDGDSWINLAFAQAQTGQSDAACEALANASAVSYAPRLENVAKHVVIKAGCHS